MAERLINAALPFLFAEAVNTHFDAEGFTAAKFIMAYVILALLVVMLDEGRRIVFLPLLQEMRSGLMRNALRTLHQKNLEFHSLHGSPFLTRAVNRAVWSLDSFCTIGLFNLIPAIVQFLLAAVILWIQLGEIYALILVSTVGFYVAYSTIYVKRQQILYGAKIGADNKMNSVVGDSLLNVETVASFDSTDAEIQRLGHAEANFNHAWRMQELHLFYGKISQSAITWAGTTMMLMMVLILGTGGQFRAGDLVLVNMYVLQVFSPLQSIGLLYASLIQSITDLRVLDALLVDDSYTRPLKGPTQPLRHRLRADHLEVAGGDGNILVKDISFDLPAGGTMAVVGPTGAGKSTLMRALAGMADLKSGQILLDGSVVSPVQVRSMALYVSQTPGLFNESIDYNLRYAASDVSEASIDEATRLLHLDTMIAARLNGGQEPVGEMGALLSGGERQRICIVRALLAQRPLIILDEATSQMDAITERSVLESLRRSLQNKTLIVVTHRLETMTDADMILYVEDGYATECGTHEMLLAHNGGYARLWAARQNTTGDDLEP